MAINVTVTPQVQEVEVSATVQPYEVQVEVLGGKGDAGTPNTIGSPANGLSITDSVLTIGLASAGVTGALSGTDWSTFNGKQGAITLTTTGSSGAATLVGTTLNIPNYGSALSGYVPYSGATANVNLGVYDLTADVITGATGSFSSSGSSNTFGITHSSGSGIALNITKGGNGEGLYINKTSGSGNAATIIGTLNATTLVKSGGTSTQYLMADGSVSTLTNPVTGTIASGQVAFGTGVNTVGGSADFTWNDSTKILSFSNGGTLIAEIRVSTINSNTFFGRSAGRDNTTGSQNSFFGVSAGRNNTTGGSNSFFGRDAGRYIANGSNLTIANNSVFLGFDTRANADNETNQTVIGYNAIGLGSNTTVIGNSSTTFGRWWGNLLIGTSTNAGFALDVAGTTRLNGLQTFQGTTASDAAPLGSELLTSSNWTTTGWTGDFSTGFTNGSGNTTALSNTLAGVVNTYYQIAYTITGRTAGSVTIAFGGQSIAGVTATGAFGPRATTTGNLVITPTADFNGTIVLSIRTISTSSATTSISNSDGTVRIEMRATTAALNTLVGNNAGRRITTGSSNSFFGGSAGFSNTTGVANSFFGVSAGLNNTTGGSNSFFGLQAGFNNTTGFNNSFFGGSAGFNNTTGNNNSFFGVSAGLNNTTGSTNSFFGLSAGQNNTTGGSNSFFGVSAGRRIANGSNLTIANNSVFLGFDTRASADNETNQTVIGYQAIGLGSNTTVIGNSSTTFGRWFGNLLIGTSTNVASSILTLESTTQGFLPPRMTTAQRDAISAVAGLVVYNTSTNKHQGYDGTTWNDFY